MARWVLLLGLAACFSPQPPAGAPCSVDDQCPSGYTCQFGVCSDDDRFAARIGFETDARLVDEQSGTLTTRVLLSHAALVPVSLSYGVAEGSTATLDADYSFTPGTLEFAVGEVEKSFDLSIAIDAVEEADETIVLTLSDISGGVVGTGTQTITISANALPAVAFTAASASGAESTSPTIDVTLDVASPLAISVDYVVSGSATAGGVDHTFVAGTLMFAPGETQKQLQPAIVADALDEADETLVITLANPVNANLGANSAHTYTITDDDPTPTVAFTAATSQVGEAAGTTTLTVSLSAVSGLPVSVPFTLGVGTATVTTDFSVTTTSPLSFAPGQTSQTITLSIVQDATAEVDETVVVTLGTPTNATLAAPITHTATILDDDRSCYGTGAFAVCLATPTATVTLPTSINTDVSSLCAATQPLGWMGQGQPASCVIAGATISAAATTTVTGTRPLVLVAADAINIAGTLDVSSRRTGTAGPGSPSLACAPFPVAPDNSNGGGGGGAGASFMSRGGNGGLGDGGLAARGQSPAANAVAPTVLRAGCDGQLAGKSGNNNPGAVGRGGGAVYLVAGNSITITGAINASGSAGTGGESVAGGSGAGSGGMIKLYATTITAIGASLFANGAGGASGGGSSLFGTSGQDPSSAATPAGGGTSTNGGGSGGSGFANATAAVAGGTGATNAGGGGGGGGGGLIQSNVALTGATVSAGVIQ